MSYVECARVNDKGVAAFKPLDDKTMDMLGNAMIGSGISIGGYVPRSLLYFSIENKVITLMWVTEEQRKPLLFDEETTLKSDNYTVPRLLWYFKNGSLYLYALKDMDEAIEKTKLYKAPFFNMMQSNEVCMGDVVDMMDIRNGRFDEIITKLEALFYETEFTHISSENMVEGLLKHYTENPKEFPYEKLIEANRTIGSLIGKQNHLQGG